MASSVGKHVDQEDIERATKPWVERVARLGFGAKGVVYSVIGILAMLAALGRGGSTTDSRGALRAIAAGPLGKTLLVVVGIGLLAYACWRFVEAGLDAKGKGNDAKGILARIAYAIIGIWYVALAYSALRISQGRPDQGGDAPQSWTARLMAQPFGRWLVVAVGIGVIAFSLYRIYRAATGDLSEELHSRELSGKEQRWARRLGAFGLSVRSVVYGLIGIFLIQAGLRYNAEEVGGLDKALQTISQQTYGSMLLGIVAVGLVAYGVYMLLIAWFRQKFTDG